MAELLGNPQFPFLLGAQVPQVDPLGIAGKALTIGGLAQQQQMGALQLQTQQQLLQAMSDPAYWQAFQNVMGGSGTLADVGQVAQKYPMAAAALQQNLFGVQEKYSQIQKNLQEAAKQKSDVQQQGLGVLSNGAYNALQNPSPGNIESVMRQIAFLRDAHGLPPEAYTSAPDVSSAQSFFPWLQQLAYLKSDPKTQQDIKQIQFTNWAKMAEESRAWQALNKPEIKVDPTTGRQIVAYPYGGPNGPQMPPPPGWVAPPMPQVTTAPPPPGQGPVTPGGAGTGGNLSMNIRNAPASDIPGLIADLQSPQPSGPVVGPPAPSTPQLPKLELTPEEKVQQAAQQTAAQEGAKVMGQTMGDLAKKVPSALEGLNTINYMRQQDAKGAIYSGGVQGKDFFKDLAGVMAALPWASQDQIDKVSRTQAFDAEAGALVFNMIAGMPGAGRITNALQANVKNIKPNTPMTWQARQQVYDYLQQAMQYQLEITKSLGVYSAKPGVTNLSGWEPPGSPGAPNVTPNPDGSWTLDLRK